MAPSRSARCCHNCIKTKWFLTTKNIIKNKIKRQARLTISVIDTVLNCKSLTEISVLSRAVNRASARKRSQVEVVNLMNFGCIFLVVYSSASRGLEYPRDHYVKKKVN